MTAHRLYVGTVGEGLFRSSDGGASFQRACEGMFAECHVRALVPHPRDPRTLFVGSEQGLFRSDDGADNWRQVDSPLNGLQIWSIHLLRDSPEVMIVGTCPARLFWSPDGGEKWGEVAKEMRRDCPRIIHTRVTTLRGDPRESGTVWAGVEIDGLWRSRDAGQTWNRAGAGLSSQDIHDLALFPTADGQHGRMLAATNNDLNLSTDGGETWQPLGIGRWLPHSYCRALAQLPGRPETVFLGNGDGPPGETGLIALSRDAGQTWEKTRMPGPANSTIWNFATHPADPQLVYASSVSGEVYRSSDGGALFEKLPREFGEIRALAWTP